MVACHVPCKSYKKRYCLIPTISHGLISLLLDSWPDLHDACQIVLQRRPTRILPETGISLYEKHIHFTVSITETFMDERQTMKRGFLAQHLIYLTFKFEVIQAPFIHVALFVDPFIINVKLWYMVQWVLINKDRENATYDLKVWTTNVYSVSRHK